MFILSCICYPTEVGDPLLDPSAEAVLEIVRKRPKRRRKVCLCHLLDLSGMDLFLPDLMMVIRKIHHRRQRAGVYQYSFMMFRKLWLFRYLKSHFYTDWKYTAFRKGGLHFRLSGKMMTFLKSGDILKEYNTFSLWFCIDSKHDHWKQSVTTESSMFIIKWTSNCFFTNSCNDFNQRVKSSYSWQKYL